MRPSCGDRSPTSCLFLRRDERKAWLGDAALTVDEALFNFDLGSFYVSWLQEIRNAQSAEGSVPDTVPRTFGKAIADPNWGTAFPTIVSCLVDHLGDVTTAKDMYSALRAWVEFLRMCANRDGLSNMYYVHGDWVPPPPETRTSGALCSAFAYLNDMQQLIALARLLGVTDDVTTYSQLYAQLAQEFHESFYDEGLNGYGDGKQTANVLALTLPDVVPAALKSTVVNSLLADLAAHNGHLTTGIVGTRYVFPLLSSLGCTDTALAIATQTTYPSYGYMLGNPAEPATTMWELWDAPSEGPGMNSRNHIMYGSIDSWLYRCVAGVQPRALEPFVVAPPAVRCGGPVRWARAVYISAKGPLRVRWEQRDEPSSPLEVAVSVPPNARCHVVLPSDSRQIYEGTALVWPAVSASAQPPGVHGVTVAKGSFVVELGSGDFCLKVVV
eukprot:TRINITY_DN833_c0_g1_i4.p2 TRINITY_DN833_c0_g1~~TRINITY_DN833_c0_g1_i4.p2  ORF type:complete len:441 (+),score=85.14 TRINITY_DN833_c0_g1_i4:1432-2754(+)